MRSPFERRITEHDFAGLAAPLIGLPISHPWRGHGSALMLELGVLHSEPLPASLGRRNGTPEKGEGSVMIEWSWRVERRRSIAFGSWSGERKLSSGVDSLRGRVVEAVSVCGRLPELCIGLDGGWWINSFSTVESQPQWALFLLDGSWLTVAGGHLIHNRQNARVTSPSA